MWLCPHFRSMAHGDSLVVAVLAARAAERRGVVLRERRAVMKHSLSRVAPGK